jgi:hypothetical protein
MNTLCMCMCAKVWIGVAEFNASIHTCMLAYVYAICMHCMHACIQCIKVIFRIQNSITEIKISPKAAKSLAS